MAENQQVTFYGGPCNGENHFYSTTELSHGVVTCKAVLYQVTPQFGNFWNAVPEASASVPATTAQHYAPDLYRSFLGLRNAVALRLRPAVTTAQRYDRIALQVLARHRKVKGRK